MNVEERRGRKMSSESVYEDMSVKERAREEETMRNLENQVQCSFCFVPDGRIGKLG
jgi:hypothetical protein